MAKINEEHNKELNSSGKKAGTSTMNSLRFWKTSTNKSKILQRAASFGSKSCNKFIQDTQLSSIDTPLTNTKLTKFETISPLEKGN
jgi:hypothetical protein